MSVGATERENEVGSLLGSWFSICTALGAARARDVLASLWWNETNGFGIGLVARAAFNLRKAQGRLASDLPWAPPRRHRTRGWSELVAGSAGRHLYRALGAANTRFLLGAP